MKRASQAMFRLTPEMNTYLLRAAKERGITRSEVVREIITQHINDQTLLRAMEVMAAGHGVTVTSSLPGVIEVVRVP